MKSSCQSQNCDKRRTCLEQTYALINWQAKGSKLIQQVRVLNFYQTHNLTNICTLFVPSRMDVPTPFESESMILRFEPWPRQLSVVFSLLFPFFSFQFPFFLKGYVRMFRVKRTSENVRRHIFYVQIDNNVIMQRWDPENIPNLTRQN